MTNRRPLTAPYVPFGKRCFLISAVHIRHNPIQFVINEHFAIKIISLIKREMLEKVRKFKDFY